MALSASLRRAHARVAITARWHGQDSAQYRAARMDFEREKLAEAVASLRTECPEAFGDLRSLVMVP